MKHTSNVTVIRKWTVTNRKPFTELIDQPTFRDISPRFSPKRIIVSKWQLIAIDHQEKRRYEIVDDRQKPVVVLSHNRVVADILHNSPLGLRLLTMVFDFFTESEQLSVAERIRTEHKIHPNYTKYAIARRLNVHYSQVQSALLHV